MSPFSVLNFVFGDFALESAKHTPHVQIELGEKQAGPD